ncbi:hypothetical protein ACIRTB_01160 [Streptomyces sp. NPDC101158]
MSIFYLGRCALAAGFEGFACSISPAADAPRLLALSSRSCDGGEVL